MACTLPPGTSTSDADLYCALNTVVRNGTVVFTATDTSPEFEELLDNWLCHARRLSIIPLVWALDETTHNKLRARTGADSVHSVYAPTVSLPAKARPNAYKKAGSEEYTLAVALKPLAVWKIVRLGFDALFLDVDVALISASPLHWLRRSTADLQLSLNYDDRPAQQKVTVIPDLNTGVLYARSSKGAAALLEEWAKRTAERHMCPRRPPLWACGDQEQITRLLKQRCGWRPLSFERAASLESANDAQRVACGGAIGTLGIEVLPPRLFASGQSSGLWQNRRAPADLLTFHPNFGGFAGGAKKAMLRRVRFESSGGSAWCLASRTERAQG